MHALAAVTRGGIRAPHDQQELNAAWLAPVQDPFGSAGDWLGWIGSSRYALRHAAKRRCAEPEDRVAEQGRKDPSRAQDDGDGEGDGRNEDPNHAERLRDFRLVCCRRSENAYSVRSPQGPPGLPCVHARARRWGGGHYRFSQMCDVEVSDEQ